jgi:oligopeptide/dipeptide ABC transporter ATP-binding protein
MAPALVVEDLEISYRARRADLRLVHGVSFDVRPAEIVGLIGESGSGKTMTLRAIAGALPRNVHVTQGVIRIGHRAQRNRNGEERSARLAMVFADPHASLDPLQRVSAQLKESLFVHQGLRGKAASCEALRLLEEVRLSDPERVSQQLPAQLSGGMAQRVMIAIALSMRPAFLLADEPTSALDATVQLEIVELLVRLVQIESVGMLLATHDMAVVRRACDRVAVMYAGVIVESGLTEEVLTRPSHPYTKLLLAARPRATRGSRLTSIAGEPPSPEDARVGCSFAPRCPYADAICHQEEPPLSPHRHRDVACHHADRVADRP